MKVIRSECVGCPPEMGCLGSACPYRNVTRYYCDECEEETTLYDSDFGELCIDCLLEKFPKIKGSEW